MNKEPEQKIIASKKHWWDNKKIFIYPAIVILVCLVGYSAWWGFSGAKTNFIPIDIGDFFRQITGQEDDVTLTDEEKTKALEVKRSETKRQLSIITEKGDSQSGQAFLDEKIKQTVESQEKSYIYMEKAILAGSYIGGFDIKSALKYAYEAEKYYPTKETAYAIAYYEESLNNIQTAIKYYKLYLDRLTPNDESGDYEYYLEYIKQLESDKN